MQVLEITIVEVRAIFYGLLGREGVLGVCLVVTATFETFRPTTIGEVVRNAVVELEVTAGVVGVGEGAAGSSDPRRLVPP
jgi:hypothetical protein